MRCYLSLRAIALVLGILLLIASAVCESHAAWQPHQVKRGDDQGGQILLPAQRQVLTIPGDKKYFMPWGLVQMDNAEIALLATREVMVARDPIMAFSGDGGDTWSEFQEITMVWGRPTNLTYLGGGNISYVTRIGNAAGVRNFSSDYGRTWSELVSVPITQDGQEWRVEGMPPWTATPTEWPSR